MPRSRLVAVAAAFVLVVFVGAILAFAFIRRGRTRRARRQGGTTIHVVLRDRGAHQSSDLAVLLRRFDNAGIDARVDFTRGTDVGLTLEHMQESLTEFLKHGELSLSLVAVDQTGIEIPPGDSPMPGLSSERTTVMVGESPPNVVQQRSYVMPTAPTAAALTPLLASLPPMPSRVPAIECVSSEQMMGANYCWPWLLETPPILTNADIADAEVQIEPYDRRPRVMITLTSNGRTRFADITGANRHRRIAIVVDGTIQSMPVVQERIPGGVVAITMGSARNAADLLAEAHTLADALASGALRDDWEFVEQH